METIIKTATTLFMFTAVDFYWGLGNPDALLSFMFDEDYRDEMSEEDKELIDWDNFDIDKYKKKFLPYIQGLADDVAEELDGVKKIKVLDIKSPSEYNFLTDWCDVDVYMEDGWIDKVLKDADAILKDETCIEFFGENFKSRSGFISFVPEDMDDYPRLVRNCESSRSWRDDKVVAIWLSLMYVHKHGRVAWENWDNIIESVEGNTDFTECFTLNKE